jgi:predicted phosphodiesterase
VRLHILNDLHLEFARWPKEVDVNAIDADVTVLAGDIGVGLEGVTWALAVFRRPVIYVLGNHEYYGQRLMSELLAAARAKCRGMHVHVLENDAVVIDGVRFLGCTLWTDFALFEEDERNARAMEEAGMKMGDFRHIMAGRRDGGYGKNKLIPFTPAMARKRHLVSRAWLEGELAKHHDGPTVVVTHHAPSARSLSYQEPSWLMDAAYASNFEHLMGREQVRLWVHGHTHLATDYEIEGTRVVSNPRGYVPGEVVGEFKPELVVRV